MTAHTVRLSRGRGSLGDGVHARRPGLLGRIASGSSCSDPG